MNTEQQLASKIKLLREVHNFTQDYVAEFIDVAQNTYSLMEKGETKLTVDRLEKLAKLYKMELVDLIRLNEQTYIHTITHSQGVCSQNVTINHLLADEERELYKSTIERLERENEKLHKLIEKLTERL
jgi:transcriptional regulator with XRE-family HTH domain